MRSVVAFNIYLVEERGVEIHALYGMTYSLLHDESKWGIRFYARCGVRNET
jgi:hypothetical protein